MGNFYVSITLRCGSEPLVEELRRLGRMAHVAVLPDGFCTVCDQRCDTQAPDELEALAATLSARLHAPALGVLNHDDDVLLCGLFEDGVLRLEYGWTSPLSGWKVPPTPRAAFRAEVLRAFGTTTREPPRMRWTGMFGRHVYAVLAHADLVAEWGLPAGTVGLGWRYVDKGEFAGAGIPFIRVP